MIQNMPAVSENAMLHRLSTPTSLDRTVKAQVFLMDIEDFNGFDEVWREFFPVSPPITVASSLGNGLAAATVTTAVMSTSRPTNAPSITCSPCPPP